MINVIYSSLHLKKRVKHGIFVWSVISTVACSGLKDQSNKSFNTNKKLEKNKKSTSPDCLNAKTPLELSENLSLITLQDRLFHWRQRSLLSLELCLFSPTSQKAQMEVLCYQGVVWHHITECCRGNPFTRLVHAGLPFLSCIPQTKVAQMEPGASVAWK